MRKLSMFVAVVLVATLFYACATCDPDEKVTIQVSTGTDLNTYLEGSKAGAHQLDLYVFKVDDPAAFLANEPSRLRVTDQGVVPGGQSIGRYEVQPGESPLIDLGVMGIERWTHIGVYAAYGSPANTGDAVKVALELPGDCACVLTLGANAIVPIKD